jgi:hypothetical protein
MELLTLVIISKLMKSITSAMEKLTCGQLMADFHGPGTPLPAGFLPCT